MNSLEFTQFKLITDSHFTSNGFPKPMWLTDILQ